MAGEVRCDDVFVQLYASDASIYQIRPLGIVLPRTTADVVTCAQYAHENHIPIHARGAGTGLAGESLGPGLVLDFSKHLRRILRTDEETVRVQPGVVLERLNSHLKKLGRQFGPDPAMRHVTTMGSVIAIDAAGSHWMRYGSARRHVKSLQVVLADGEVLELGQEKIAPGGGLGSGDRRSKIVNQLAEVIGRDEECIRAHQPKSLVNRCGYQIADVLSGDEIDVGKVLTGSEGTLALITEATLATQPLPKYRGVALLFFDGLERAARAVQDILPFEPSACDLIDRRHLSLARETDPRYRPLIPPTAEAMLLVEQEGDDSAEVRDRLHQVVDRMRRKKKVAFDSRLAFDDAEVDLFWNLALKVVPTLYRLKGSKRPLPIVEDVAVPPAAMPGFLVQLQNILKQHQVTASLFAHAGHGQLHIRPFLDLANPDEVRKSRLLANDLYEAVFDVGGTISGEHGDGLSRTSFVRRQYGDLYRTFHKIKQIFDPENILNPGKIVGDDPQLMTRNLRPVLSPWESAPSPGETNGPNQAPDVVHLQLNWSPGEMAHMARACNGCGSCRSQAPDVRMCPIFRFAPREESSPRAKANLMRGILTGQLDPSNVASEEFKAVADLCVNCHMCRLECPASVDIPKLMIEAKAAYVRAAGLTFGDWVLTRLDLIGALSSLFNPIANWAISNRQARWLIEKTLGIAQGRKLPRASSRTFLRRAARRRLTRPTRRSGRKVLYFVDNYVNYYDTQLGEALVAVMEHNGVAVYVHPGQWHSAMAMISLGSLDRAHKVVRHNVNLLAEAVRQGYHIVATEPSAVLALVHEYPSLMDEDDAHLVAENSSEACDYLWRMHLAGKLQLDFNPVNVSLAYHTPCHIKALEVGTPGHDLLRLIPSLAVNMIEEGCSGMAGTFGLKKENYRSSLRAGWGLISSLRQSNLQIGATECSSCKMQMEQGTTKPTIHPLKLLALAYGLMPEAAKLLTAQSEELTVT